MILSMRGQVITFLAAAGSGAAAAFIFDLFRVLRGATRHSNFLTHVEDMLFWMAAGLFLWYVLLNAGGGSLRFYEIMAVILGAILYFATVSIFIRSFFGAVIELLKKPFIFMIKLLKKCGISVKLGLRKCQKYVKINIHRLAKNGGGILKKHKSRGEGHKFGSKLRLFIILAMIIVFSLVIYRGLYNVGKLAAKSQALDIKIEAARIEEERIKAERLNIDSDAAIEKIARERLGLVMPDEIIFIKED